MKCKHHTNFPPFLCLWSAAVAGPNAGEEEDALPTYKEAFPPLPEKAASAEGTQETANAWTNKIRPLKSSIITQVYISLKDTTKYDLRIGKM